jgi:hypothetical protein
VFSALSSAVKYYKDVLETTGEHMLVQQKNKEVLLRAWQEKLIVNKIANICLAKKFKFDSKK